MPVLALTAWRLPRGRTRSWALAALTASWLGDTLPRFVAEAQKIPVLIGCFTVAQLCWIVALWPTTRRQHRRANLALALGVLPSAWLVSLCLPTAGALAPAVVVYALLLLTTVSRAASWGVLGVGGGVLFWISDSLIAVTTFVPQWRFGWSDLAIMPTYAIAQALLVAAVATRPRPSSTGSPGDSGNIG
ncbi:lysoplasmalogenase [Naumannella sp. ID2617S]|nr:lysoplasmalogenase [Naumannella sp. ID2617S]